MQDQKQDRTEGLQARLGEHRHKLEARPARQPKRPVLPYTGEQRLVWEQQVPWPPLQQSCYKSSVAEALHNFKSDRLGWLYSCISVGLHGVILKRF